MMKHLRFVTAASLFDGHDVSINIMRRLLQSKGVEVIHLGHNRSAQEVVNSIIEEDAHGVALSSYQGGHNEYFSYIRELLNQKDAKNVRIFGGGGGVITSSEVKELERKGITKIYTPEDGMALGLEGIIDDMIEKASYSTIENIDFKKLEKRELSKYEVSKVITFIEEKGKLPYKIKEGKTSVLGITGTGGAGKSSLIDEILLRFNQFYKNKKMALISVDPTKKKTQGALLGDRIRLGSASFDDFFIRSLATRSSKTELSPEIEKTISFLKGQGFDLIIVETSGIGQASYEITKIADKCIYVMTPEYGAATQLEKIEMLEQADMIVLNKFEKPRSEDSLRDIRKQYRRIHKLFSGHPNSPSDEELPIFGTIASQFNDVGINDLFYEIAKLYDFDVSKINGLEKNRSSLNKSKIIGTERALYLREITKVCKEYNLETKQKMNLLKDYEALVHTNNIVKNKEIEKKLKEVQAQIGKEVFSLLDEFNSIIKQYESGNFSYKVRGKEITSPTKFKSLSGLEISKVSFPKYSSLEETFKFLRNSHLPGYFPYASGIFPFKREDEDPKRMFAGEGGPRRTNERFHYLSKDDKAKRLSTAFDAVTLYGEDPDQRPDIFGKIGEAGVSIATLDDMKVLFDKFDLTDLSTSVSMTINGPAAIILAFFMNTAIAQKLSGKDYWDDEKRNAIISMVRGTVQSDILKEDQAQNTCIFSLDFALRMMGDVQEYFCKHKIRNYYSVSISGYHIAEAGANPITQVAFTLSNAFTFVEYYLGRGMNIDDFSQNLSFFFSNGLDPEYTVIGRVARKIWSVTIKNKYNGNEKSQKFKYHIQTSGRSLHAQEIDFNDIRTTLQALLALSDNCNSLHTNAYDEAITTPTKESVRRAMAIQMIINKEFGMSQNDNPLQGSYFYEELAEIVELSIIEEFDRISDKGGVLGAMESMYQRGKIQEESLLYETLKDSGELPIIGVNTYLAKDVKEKLKEEIQISRSSNEEKQSQIDRLGKFKNRNKKKSEEALERLKQVCLDNKNIFEELLYTTNYCSLGEITNVLYQVGGRYRRNM